MMKSLLVLQENDKEVYRLLVKGALETISKNCTRQLDFKGVQADQIGQLEPIQQELILKNSEYLQKESYRLVGMAYRDFDDKSEALKCYQDDTEWVFIGFIGLRDEIRPEVKESIKLCKKAGIRVIMVTGDNVQTAQAIAKNCGILKGDSSEEEFSENSGSDISRHQQELVMDGEEFIRRVGGL